MYIGFIFIVYLFISIIAYGRLPHTFFLQDEWAIFGNYLYWDKAHLDWLQRLFIYQQYTHIIPFGNLISYVQFRLFGLYFPPYGIVSIIWHLINSFLVYLLARKLTKHRWVAFVAGLLFLTTSVSHQAVTWIATTAGTVGSVTFLLLSLIFFVPYIENTENRKRSFFLSLCFFLISLGFKETSLFAFVLFPIFWLLFERKKTRRKLFQLLGIMSLLGVAYLVLRLGIASGESRVSAASELSQPTLLVYTYRFFTTPFKVLVQSFFPVSVILMIARSIVSLGYPQFMQGGSPDPHIVESVASDVVSLSVSIFIIVAIGTCYLFFEKCKESRMAKSLLFSLFFVLTSALPLIVIPGRAGFFSLLDGRHLYSTNVLGSLLFALGIYATYRFFPNRKIFPIVLVFCVGMFMLYHVRAIRGDMYIQAAVGKSRLALLSAILHSYPKLPPKIIVYVESDKAYYGLAPTETIPPFQSGFGQTLLVWYNAHGDEFPACFFKDQYLYVLLSEDYKECEGRGFGYFRKIESLKEATLTHAISPTSIIGFRYHSITNSLEDITNEVRNVVYEK